mgnify:CR=1 FL=1
MTILVAYVPRPEGQAALDRLQPPQYQPKMQQKQVESAVNRIRHAQVPVK